MLLGVLPFFCATDLLGRSNFRWVEMSRASSVEGFRGMSGRSRRYGEGRRSPKFGEEIRGVSREIESLYDNEEFERPGSSRDLGEFERPGARRNERSSGRSRQLEQCQAYLKSRRISESSKCVVSWACQADPGCWNRRER